VAAALCLYQRSEEAGMLLDWAYVAVFAVVGAVMVALPLAVIWLISPRSAYPLKRETYESGMPTIGQAWAQFNVRYYLFALVFVVFDVEIIYLYPWAVVGRSLGALAFVEILVFLVILALGLVYAWRKGALEWM
jgi:NADH:ubiquinone oxidoreductase subunit 3 (subunit A)